jgi:hypothetical protein
VHQWTLLLAGGNLAAGRATHAKQVLGKVPSKEKYIGMGRVWPENEKTV